jgi:chloride channel protein, CIC family
MTGKSATDKPVRIAPHEPRHTYGMTNESRPGFLTGWADGERLRRHEDKVLLLLTLVIGAIVGLVVVAFILLTENLGMRLFPAEASGWRRLLVPTLGALVSGILLYRYFPGARGSGIPQAKTALFLHDGDIPLRTVLGKFGCSGLSLASGIALGREGPAVHIGAGIASVIARRLGLRPAQVKRLVPVGASAALAAAFNTPIAAVLFSLEEVMGNLHAPVLGSVVLASATSWMVLHLLLGDEPLFHVPAYQLVHPVEFLIYAVLGVIGGLVSVAFVKLLLGLRGRFLAMPRRTVWFQPALGGLAIGLMGWFVPAVLGVGYGHVGEALNGKIPFGMMGLLLGLKLVATATAYASGNAGGIFGPSLFLGAMMGGAVGGFAHTLFPDYTSGVGAYALVGMGAAFAGIVRVPMTSVIMIFEITRDYTIIVPLMIANLVSYLISARLQPEPIYEALLHQDRIRLPSGRDVRDERLVVGLAMRAATERLSATERVADAANRLARAATEPPAESATPLATPGREAWPVMDEGGLVGMVSADILQHAEQQGRGSAAVKDVLPEAHSDGVLAEPAEVLHADDSLDTALTRMAAARMNRLPVVSRDDDRALLGTVSVLDVLKAYGDAATNPQAEEVASLSHSPRRLLAGVATVTVVLLVLAGALAYYYREERLADGQRSLARGQELLRQGRDQEAIDQLRNALVVTRTPAARLALGDALVTADRLEEAGIYFREVLRNDPASGRANLGLARVLARQGDTNAAVLHYGRAGVGTWPNQAETHRVDTRFELAELLARTGSRNQAVAQLLEIEREASQDVGALKRAGRMFLDLGAPEHAAEVFRGLLKASPRDADAVAGLGEASFLQADYASALTFFRQARQLVPTDAAVAQRLSLCEQIAALDPTRRGLKARERYDRSLKLVAGALARVDQCVAASPNADLGPSVSQLRETASSVLHARWRPPSYADAAEQNINLASQLWEAGRTACSQAGDRTDPVGMVLDRLARAEQPAP